MVEGNDHRAVYEPPDNARAQSRFLYALGILPVRKDSLMDKQVPILDIINGHATVETKGLYRVVHHNTDKRTREIYRDEEFLTAEEAIQSAEIHNNLTLCIHGKKAFKRQVWAEAVSYSATEQRWKDQQERDDRDERDARLMSDEQARWEKKTRKLRKQLNRLKAAQ